QAALAEARIELPGGVVAGQGEVLAAAAVADSCHHDPAVGLEGEGVGPVLGSTEVGDGHTLVTEGRIERAGGQVSGDDEVVGPSGVGHPGGQDAAVGLHGGGVTPVVGPAEIDR